MDFNLKFLKVKKKFRKGGTFIKLDLFWKYIVYTTLFLVIFALAFGFYIFFEINNKQASLRESIQADGAIKADRIDRVLEYFKQRQNKSIEILKNPSPIVDPS